jgi:hypothetical protein
MDQINEVPATNDRPVESGADGPDRGSGERQGLHAHLDEVKVQIALADLGIVELVRQQLDTAVNVCLAAKSRLGQVREEAEAGLDDLSHTLDRVLRDLRDVYDSADAVVRRGRS